jgi:hypothetical protein
MQVRRLWDDLMAVIPDAETAADADPAAIEAVIRPLGFQRFRARGIIAMSADYLLPWTRPSELRFIGKYASDAYWIFCRCSPKHEHPFASSACMHDVMTIMYQDYSCTVRSCARATDEGAPWGKVVTRRSMSPNRVRTR